MEEGEKLQPLKGEGDVSVVEIERYSEFVQVYNLSVEKANTYYIGDKPVLVHNAKNCNKWKPKVKKCKSVGGGKRRENWISEKGEPNTVGVNASGTTRKVYGPNGWATKTWNKGHGPGAKHNKYEVDDHIHDHKPNPYHPEGKPDRLPGRRPRKRDLCEVGL